MDLITRYVQAVVSQLPMDQREDIAAELTDSLMEQIEEMQEKSGREVTEDELTQFIKALGHPNKMAAGYAQQSYLIGPEHFPSYKMALKVVLKIIVTLQLLFSAISIATGSSITTEIFSLIYRIFWNGITAIGTVTAVFAVMEYYGERIDLLRRWDPSKLPNALAELKINRPEALFNLLVASLALGWWNDWLSVSQLFDSQRIVMATRLSPEWQSLYWPINVILASSIIITAYELVQTHWTKSILIIELALNLATAGLVIYIIQFDQLIIVEQLGDVAQKWLTNSESWLNSTVLTTLVIILAAQLYEAWFVYAKNLRVVLKHP